MVKVDIKYWSRFDGLRYILKHKDEVFKFFQEWKALVEKARGKKLKVLRTDKGSEFTSVQFEKFFRHEGIHHDLHYDQA